MLPYKNETVDSPDGISCKVLDTQALDFSSAVEGRKATETLVRRAEGGEAIETKNKAGQVESVYEAKPGDAIFINLHNADDVYVPGNADGTRWQFKDLTARGYEITGEDQERGGVRVKSAATAKLLHEAVAEPTCIRDAWGEGQHQFLFAGATLKQGNQGRATGIDKGAFDATWEITKAAPVRGLAVGAPKLEI
jgi:hypothetical protein